MWRWDQGRMAYFQYDVLRTISEFVTNHDLRNSQPAVIRAETGLTFPPQAYAPWRNYARILKLCLIVSEEGYRAIPTDIAAILSQTGTVTCDEYLHFLAQATTDPSPALSNWDNQGRIRHPLCFTLKYILARVAILGQHETSIDQIIGAYIESDFDGDEDENDFAGLVGANSNHVDVTHQLSQNRRRQSRESIKFLSQISYLYTTRDSVIVALSREDAVQIFQAITPVQGPHPYKDHTESMVTKRFAGSQYSSGMGLFMTSLTIKQRPSRTSLTVDL